MNAEFENYKREVLSKAGGAHIHRITNDVYSIGIMYELIEDNPTKEVYYTSKIESAKSEIYKLLHP